MMTVPEEMTLFGSLPCGAGCGKGTPGAGDGAAEAECLRSGPFTLRRYAQGRDVGPLFARICPAVLPEGECGTAVAQFQLSVDAPLRCSG